MGGLTFAPCVAISLSRTPRFLHPKTAHKNQAMRCDLVNLKIDLNYVFQISREYWNTTDVTYGTSKLYIFQTSRIYYVPVGPKTQL